MEKLQKAEDLLLSLNNRLDQLAVISKADPAYRLEREEIQQEMRALYEELSGEKLEGEVQEQLYRIVRICRIKASWAF